jgi:hypothetical protein
MIAAMPKSATFLVNCIDTFLERTRPASSMAKPAAIQKTRKPPMRNSSELKMKTVCSPTGAAASTTASAAGSASCAKAGSAIMTVASAAVRRMECFENVIG